MAIAAATAARASLFASSIDLVPTCDGRVAAVGSTEAFVEVVCTALPEDDCNGPLTGRRIFRAGLGRGMAGMILPLLGPAGTGLVKAIVASVAAGAGGASAAATSGLDSFGGVGAFRVGAEGLGVAVALGSLTVATGLVGDVC